MLGDTFKDLSKGDRVKYDYEEYYTKERVAGEGVIYGFGQFGESELVWIKNSNGELQLIPYEEAKKMQRKERQ